jgi:hypothetical protein
VPATIGRAFYQRAERQGWIDQCELGGGADDEPDAYRSSPTNAPGYTVVLLVEPDSGSIHGFVPKGHNFGLEAAIINYNSKPELLCAIARRLFAVVVEHYFDDYHTQEPRFALGREVLTADGAARYPGSSQGVLWRVALVLGLYFARAKHVPWAHSSPFSGAITDFSALRDEGVIKMRCKQSTDRRLWARRAT